MSERDDGGPAYPTEPNTQPGFYSHHGMSLRDHFAGEAPVDWGMAQQAARLGITVSPADRLKLWASMAIMRYEYADAMLAERAKGGA